MASTFIIAINEQETNRLNKAWIDYVKGKAVNGRFPYKKSFISVEALTNYKLVDCLRSDASIWENYWGDCSAIMKEFIAEKCGKDDWFLMDLLSYLIRNVPMDIGKLSLWECWPPTEFRVPLHGMFSESCLLREINSPLLRNKVLDNIIFHTGHEVRSILANRLFDAITLVESSEEKDDMRIYQVPLCKYLSNLLDDDLQQWEARFLNLKSSQMGPTTYSTSPEIRYVGSYLCNMLEIYEKSCEDKEEQLFISGTSIESIRELLGTISQLANAASTAARSEIISAEASMLASRIDRILQKTKDTNWPQDRPKGYSVSIKWPDPIEGLSKGDGSENDPINGKYHLSRSQKMLIVAVVVVIAFLLLGRRSRSSCSSIGSVSSSSADLIKDKMQNI